MVNGIGAVKAMFRRKAARVISEAKQAAKQGGEEVASDMRYLAPKREQALVKSIRVEDADQVLTRQGSRSFIGVIVAAGDTTTVITNSTGQQFQNAKLQEHGTKNMPANPYFNPAWRANRSRVRARITRAIRRAWQS